MGILTTNSSSITFIKKSILINFYFIFQEPDETLGERIMGLAEMFPQPLRDFTGGLVNFTTSSIKGLYKFSCNASWIFFTSSVILFAPVIFETERAQMEEMQKTQQKQVLLGPGSAMSAVGETPALPLIR